MKKLLNLLMLILIIMTSIQLKAQVPQAFNYQAIARDNFGNLLSSQAIGIKIIIHQGSSSGTEVYSETFTKTTTQFGLFTLPIGQGVVTSGNFNSIVWSTGNYWLQVQIDPAGGTSYIDMGTSQLLTIPYAMYAANAGVPGITGATGPTGATGATGATGTNGISIHWLGTWPTIPSSPALNDAYYYTTDHISYIWDGAIWQILAQDGATGATGPLVAGTNGQTLRNNGSNWVAMSNLSNDGTNIGIGTTKPRNLLEVKGFARFPGSYTAGIRFVSATANYGIGMEMLNNLFTIRKIDTAASASPYVDIIDIDPSATVIPFEPYSNNAYNLGSPGYAWANVYGYNAYQQTSDQRMKKNIKDIDYGISTIMKLRPVSYEWNTTDNGEKKLGFIAQEVENILPEVVQHNFFTDEQMKRWKEDGKKLPNKDVYSMAYSDMIPVLVKAIQEQQTIIEKLQTEKQTQDTSIEDLQKQIDELKALITSK